MYAILPISRMFRNAAGSPDTVYMPTTTHIPPSAKYRA